LLKEPPPSAYPRKCLFISLFDTTPVGPVIRWVLVVFRSVPPGLQVLSSGRDGSLEGQEGPKQDRAFPRRGMDRHNVGTILGGF
jgi:hypothetical protein